MKRRQTAQVPRKKCRSGKGGGERVLARLEKCRQSSSYVMALAIDGRELDSVELSQKLEKLGTDGISHVIFLIGGSLGMSKELLAAADFKLSFFQNDVSTPADARDSAGADLPRLPHHEPGTLPQIAAGYSVKSLEYRTVPSGFKAVSRMAMPFMPVSSAICARSEEKSGGIAVKNGVIQLRQCVGVGVIRHIIRLRKRVLEH